jgi:transcriptional regulator with XRE-family HTH domain
MLEKSGLKIMSTAIKSYSSYSAVSFQNTSRCHSGITAMIPLCIWTAGTGGFITAHSAAEILNRIHDPRIHVERSSINLSVDTRSPAEHVANIRDALEISMSDLASVLGVTRPTAYAWIEGQEPKTESVRKIEQLSRIADEINRANIIRLDKLVHRQLSDGRSLIDLLRTGEDLTDCLTTLKLISKKEAKTRQESKGSGQNLRSLDDVLDEFSIVVEERS